MAILQVQLPVYDGGRSVITINFCCKRSGSNNDNCDMRVIRTMPGHADFILPGMPSFVLPGDKDARGWTFIDPDLPATGTATYTLQIKRNDGSGTFFEMVMTGMHHKR